MNHVDITGFDLTIDQIARVVRGKALVTVAPDAIRRMDEARTIVDDAVARGEKIYGVTTSVGAKTGVPLAPERIGEFNRRLLLTHNVAHGPLASPEAVRAMMLVLLNSMASGRLGVRPLLAERLTNALNTDRKIDVHVWGSMGQSDMAPITDLALSLYGDLDLQAGEALALLNSSALALGIAALAMADLQRSLDLWSLIGALSMEGFAANPSIVSEAALRSRPFAGLERHGRRIRRYLDGSYILAKGGPRHLQDPLSFRSLPLLHGTAADSLDFAWRQIETEFRSSQNNPIVSLEERSLVSVANFDTVSLSMALDIARLTFAPVVTASAERVAKQVDSFWSGLTVGLIEEDGVGLPGFNGLAQFHKAITSEARLATAPVVQELASSSHSNGNLDRAGMATFAARKTLELGDLCKSIAAIELMVAAQATQSRKATPLGATTGKLFALVRETVPFAAAGDRVPYLDPLLRHIEVQRDEIDALIGAGD
jgi:histidine ammonia-lyase